MKKYTTIAVLVVIAILLISSCGLLGDGGVTLRMQSSEAGASSSVVSRSVVAPGIEITDFLLSIREVEFKTQKSDPDSPADVFFAGPYSLDLLNPTGPVAQTIGEADVPPGEYQAIRFKLHKTVDVDPDSPLYDRSIYLAGTINDVPFEMWHDTSENLDISEATGVIVGDAPITVTINFQLPAFLDQVANGGVAIDLTTATDVDGDGLIEISPNSDDGATNEDIADSLKDNIKLVADIVDS